MTWPQWWCGVACNARRRASDRDHIKISTCEHVQPSVADKLFQSFHVLIKHIVEDEKTTDHLETLSRALMSIDANYSDLRFRISGKLYSELRPFGI